MPPAPPDPFHLDRFVDAQAPCHATVVDELRRGRKRTHWMWFIFPQLAGLGSSATARHFALSGEAEARAYLNHPVLGARLVACAEAMLAAPGDSATAPSVRRHPNIRAWKVIALEQQRVPSGLRHPMRQAIPVIEDA